MCLVFLVALLEAPALARALLLYLAVLHPQISERRPIPSLRRVADRAGLELQRSLPLEKQADRVMAFERIFQCEIVDFYRSHVASPSGRVTTLHDSTTS